MNESEHHYYHSTRVRGSQDVAYRGGGGNKTIEPEKQSQPRSMGSRLGSSCRPRQCTELALRTRSGSGSHLLWADAAGLERCLGAVAHAQLLE